MRLRMKAFVATGEAEDQQGSTVIHHTEINGHSVMLGMPLSGPLSEREEDIELDVMITGMGSTQWVDGSIRNVIKVEPVRAALKHMLCNHEGWERATRHTDGVVSTFHIPALGKVNINAERRSRIIRIPRQLKIPGRAWLGFNPRTGAYLAGLESFSDLFIREIRIPNRA